MNKYSERLLEEWKQHGKIIISVDYDDTLYPWRKDFNGDDIERTIKLVQQAYNTGAYIVIFTASDPDRYEEIQNHCESIKLPINAINKNAIPLPYGNNGKIYYNINLCDRSGLTEALNILEEAMYAYRGHQQSLKTTDVL
jgi:hydroxymethylpyrimidine pyrophosphatase-like HAD family hydrolase